MADNTQNILKSAIKSLEQVVAPAVNPQDPLASEQLRLVIGTLKVLRTRLDHLAGRQLYELDHYLALARSLRDEADEVSPEIAERLSAAIEAAEQLRANPDHSPADRRRVTRALASPISALAREASSTHEALRSRIERKVVTDSRRWVDMQRAWFLTHGFELRPSELPALDTLFHQPPGRA